MNIFIIPTWLVYEDGMDLIHNAACVHEIVHLPHSEGFYGKVFKRATRKGSPREKWFLRQKKSKNERFDRRTTAEWW